MKKRIIAIASFLVVVIIVLTFTLSIPSNAVSITTATVKTSNLVSDIDYSGVIKAEQNFPVISETGGRVLSVHALLGQVVKKDDILFVLDSTDIALQYNQAEANYQAAEATYEKIAGGSVKESEMQARQTLVRAQNELRDATTAYHLAKTQYDNHSAIASAQSSYDMAKAEYDRIKMLVSLGEESQYSLNTAKSKMDSAAAQLELAKSSALTALGNAESRLKNAQTALKNAQEDYNLTIKALNPENIKSAQAQKNSAQAALDIIKKKLDDASVKAPASGQISMSNISVGDMVVPQTPVMTIVNVDGMEITLHVTESGASQVFVGMPAKITLLSNGEVFDGKVEAVAAALDENTGLLDVKVAIENSGKKIKAGMLANVKLMPTESNRKIYVPIKSVLSLDNNPYVYIIDKNKIKKVPVELGEKKYAYIEVTKGLSDNSQVVVEGNTLVKENSTFRIVKTVI